MDIEQQPKVAPKKNSDLKSKYKGVGYGGEHNYAIDYGNKAKQIQKKEEDV